MVCRQIGFTRGVLKTTQGLVHGKVEAGRKATERIDCSGDEARLEDCVLEEREGPRSCKLEEDIISVSCVPDPWAACNVGNNLFCHVDNILASAGSFPGGPPATASIPRPRTSTLR